MKHDWVYEDEKNRKCKNCLIEEMYYDDAKRWVWMCTEDFMDSMVSCDEEQTRLLNH